MRRDIRSELRGVLPEDKLKLVLRSFDIIGSKQKAVAIIQLPDALKEFEHQIAAAITNVHKNVVSVLAKESGRLGEFRTRELRLVAGDPDTEVVHKESECLFKLDPRKVYFSPRESAERERIAAKVGDGESILIMFSGVGPFPICIAKRHRSIRVTAIELNPHAHNYCVENISLNKVDDRVVALQGDVKEVCPKLGKVFDRILMPLPRDAHMFLDAAIPLLRDRGVLHFYHWSPESDLFSYAEGIVSKAAERCGRMAETLERVKVSQYSPRVWKIRIDVRVSGP